MIDPKLQEAQNVVAEYKAHNLNTVERSVQIGPKTWVMKKVTIDKRAKDLVEKLNNSYKTKNKNTNQNLNPKPQKRIIKETVRVPKLKSKREKVYNDFVSGMSRQQIAEKYDISLKTVSAQVSKHKKELGIAGNSYGSTYRKALKYFMETDLNNTEIAKIIKVTAHTICYHRKKYLSETEKP